MQSLISYTIGDKPYQSFIPVYGSYYSYKQKSEKIQEKIIFLQKICFDINKKIKENSSSKKLDEITIQELTDRYTNMCKKIDALKTKKQVAEQQYKISMGARVLSPIASFAVPGSGMLVSLGSSVVQAVVHNRKSEETGENKKSLVKTATLECLKETSMKILKTTAETLTEC